MSLIAVKVQFLALVEPYKPVLDANKSLKALSMLLDGFVMAKVEVWVVLHKSSKEIGLTPPGVPVEVGTIHGVGVGRIGPA